MRLAPVAWKFEDDEAKCQYDKFADKKKNAPFCRRWFGWSCYPPQLPNMWHLYTGSRCARSHGQVQATAPEVRAGTRLALVGKGGLGQQFASVTAAPLSIPNPYVPSLCPFKVVVLPAHNVAE